MFELLCGIDLIDAENLRIDKEGKAVCSLNIRQLQTRSRQKLMSRQKLKSQQKLMS